jgi:predicted GTPase
MLLRRGQVIAVVLLITLPFVVLFTAGTYTLWESGWLRWLWWTIPAGWGLAYLIMRWGPRSHAAATASNGPLPVHWTPRDEAAFEIVRQEKDSASEVPISQLSDPHFYLQTALDLSRKIARHYHPKSPDPISSLTVLEVMAAAQMAVEDTSQWLHQNVPGSHLLTIRHWRALSHAPRWMRAASDATWLIAVCWNPLNLPRWLASHLTTSSATQEIEASLLAAFHREFVHNVGLYCIEMNSGRLRGGAARHRAALAALRGDGRERPVEGSPSRAGAASGSADGTRSVPDNLAAVTIAVVGQVNAGKSSLINALLGANRARCDVLPSTSSIDRYRVPMPVAGQQLELLDTPGYGGAELSPRERRAIQDAWSESDLVLLVMDVTSPARQADWRTLMEIKQWYESQPQRKPPPVLGVLTHMDGLSPAWEWQPPYNWREPIRPKERSIRAAVEYAEKVFGAELDAVIPVSSGSNDCRPLGCEEWLWPAILAELTDAKASLVVRLLHRDVDGERLRQLVQQLRAAGSKLLQTLWEAR